MFVYAALRWYKPSMNDIISKDQLTVSYVKPYRRALQIEKDLSAKQTFNWTN